MRFIYLGWRCNIDFICTVVLAKPLVWSMIGVTHTAAWV
jgi:hypothetical protein